jgi:hypothetical protein
MFRNLIQDVDEQRPEYRDEAIRDMLITAAKLVSGDLGLASRYTIVTETTTITPDPVEANDDGFINLMLLRAQLFLVIGEWRKSVRKSFLVNLGPRVSMNTAVSAEVYANLVKALKDQYATELVKYKLNDTNGITTIMSGSPVGPDYPEMGETFPMNGPLSH